MRIALVVLVGALVVGGAWEWYETPTAADLERELAAALRADGPRVIEALVDPAHYSQTVYD